jgi:peptidoglycan/xylan/chitin deacetylase (PgdA/CDA1 family)
VYFVKYAYGFEKNCQASLLNLPINAWIEPYIHQNDSELMTNLQTGVVNGFLSHQTASERASKYSKNDEIQRIMDEDHEVACHGCDHWQPQASDVFRSKEIIEKLTGLTIKGYRQPRMFPVSDEDIEKAGYRYNSSLNPAFIPGRYMHLTAPRTWFMRGKVMEIPASVTPLIRFPLFWLSLHNLPEKLYHMMVRRVLRHDGYFVTYFHPWEFFELKEHPEFKMPFIIKNHSGHQMVQRLDTLIKMLKKRNEKFVTYAEFVEDNS